jgi:hypothetical protein
VAVHESVTTTQIYLPADMALKQRALDRTTPLSSSPGRYKPPTSSSRSWKRCDYADTASPLAPARQRQHPGIGITTVSA